MTGLLSGAPISEVYTVVTYDPRGFAHSTIDDPDQDAEPDLLAGHVETLIAHEPPLALLLPEGEGVGPIEMTGVWGAPRTNFF